MPQDALCLYHTAIELNSTLKGGKVNKINMPSQNTLIFNIYNGKNYRLLLDLSSEYCRIHLTYNDYESPPTPSNFCQLLRKYLIGATIEGVEIVNFDRIVRLDFISKLNFERNKVALYAEIMGRYSNLFFCDEKKLLGILKQAELSQTAKRPLLVGARYTLPQTQDKISPLDFEKINRLFEHYNKTPDFLQSNILGLSAYSANVISTFLNKQKESFAKHFLGFITNNATACIVLKDNLPSDFFIRQIDENMIETDTLSLAIEKVYDHKIKKKAIIQLKNTLSQSYKKKLEKAEKKLGALLQKNFESGDFESFKQKGDLIINNIYKIKQGQNILLATDYSTTPPSEIKITLDEKLTAAQNAKAYYKKYTKKKNTVEVSQRLIKKQKVEVENLKKTIDKINQADSLDKLNELADTKTFSKTSKSGKIGRSYFRNYIAYGFNIKVGRSSIENDLLIKQSNPDDIWLHTKNYQSAHTVIECKRKELPFEVIVTAAEICAFYSKASQSQKVEVDYCPIKFVKKIKGAKAGSVNYTDFKTVLVTPNKRQKFLSQP